MNRTFAVHRHAVQLSILALMLRGKELARRTTSATPQQLTQSGQTHYSDDVDAHTHGAPDPTPNLPSRYRFFDPGTQRRYRNKATHDWQKLSSKCHVSLSRLKHDHAHRSRFQFALVEFFVDAMIEGAAQHHHVPVIGMRMGLEDRVRRPPDQLDI
jgi:hypothetical protein